MTLHIVAIFMLFVAVFTTLLFAHDSSAAPGINQTLNFQGRLLRSSGAPVPDGYYNIQFTLYEGGAGTQAGNPGGQAVWTETYVNNNANGGIRVKNGLMSVNLGSQTPFGQSVNWNNDTLWLSMNVAGSQPDCTTFNQGSCSADGEMLPMKRLTSTPYAMNAGALGGKAAENFVQIAQGVQTDTSNNTSSIHLNKTGTGNIVQLQNNGNNVFSVTNDGNLEFGNSRDHAIYVGGSPENTAGRNLTIFAGYGGSGDGSMGGSLFLQGGSAGGDNANGGDVAITGGTGNGTGRSGSVYIGASDTDTVQIGSAWHSGTQTINIGNNTGTGRTDVTVGGNGEGSGETRIQSGDDTTISTNGTQRARFSGEGNTLYLGNADSSGQATVATGFTIQGTSSTAVDVQGGSVNIVAGSATSGNANGGNLVLRGGSGSGSGSDGLVIIDTPTFQTSTGDANCFTGGALVSESCTFTSASVNSSAVLMAGFSKEGRVATIPDPATTTPGRIMYVTAAAGTEVFTLRTNADSSAERLMTMQHNMTLTFLWNGADWSTVGAPAEQPSELASNRGAEIAGTTNTTFPSSTWYSMGSASISRSTDPTYVTQGNASVRVDIPTGSQQNSGAFNRLQAKLKPETSYNISFKIGSAGNAVSSMTVAYLHDDTATEPAGEAMCDMSSVPSYNWLTVNCTITTPSFGITNDNYIAIVKKTGTQANTLYIDELSVKANVTTPSALRSSDSINSMNLSSDQSSAESVPDDNLFTLNSSPSEPDAGTADEELLGSMYYDETLGKVQCYEAEGWGSCGTAPDTFVSLSPSFPGAVIDESSIGDATFSTGFCSDSLGVNNSTDNPICGEGETRNYYELRASEPTPQESRSTFYVTHTLPENFKEFVPDTTHIAARSLGANTQVTYQFYKNRNGEVTPCGTATTAATGTTSWQEIAAQGDKDPSRCDFGAGDNVLVKIELTLPQKLSAEETLAAYVSDINFVYRINN